jgi:putative SOS response-associated peptidase YedK
MPVHDRMPVLLSPESWSVWINHMNQNKEKLLTLLKPYPAEKMKMDKVAIRQQV